MRWAYPVGLLALLVVLGCPLGPAADAGPDLPDGGAPPLIDAGPLAAVRINEVVSRNSAVLADPFLEFDDWIELFNEGETAAELDGFTLVDEGGAVFAFPALSLPPAGFTLIFADGQPEQGPEHAAFRLAGGGETLTLRDAAGRQLDLVIIPELAVDQAAGVTPEGVFDVLIEPTPRAPNRASAIRPGEPAVSGVVINEILAENLTGLSDGTGPEDWVELHNTSAEAQDLIFHHLSDSLDARAQFTFEVPTVIEPGGYLIVFLDSEPSQGDLHAGFGLATAGDAIVFSAPDTEVLDQHAFGPQQADTSLARVPDGTGPFTAQAPTPGAQN